jgi:uncharacterized membrane protein YkoI
MGRKTKWIAGGAIALAVIGAGTGSGIASSGDSEQPLTGSTLDHVARAALEHTGGGTVVETEVGDDGAAYGVEVRLPDGAQVEVHLDSRFNVIGQEGDEDPPSDRDGQGDS